VKAKTVEMMSYRASVCEDDQSSLDQGLSEVGEESGKRELMEGVLMGDRTEKRERKKKKKKKKMKTKEKTYDKSEERQRKKAIRQGNMTNPSMDLKKDTSQSYNFESPLSLLP